jgi:hypothetical protein
LKADRVHSTLTSALSPSSTLPTINRTLSNSSQPHPYTRSTINNHSLSNHAHSCVSPSQASTMTIPEPGQCIDLEFIPFRHCSFTLKSSTFSGKTLHRPFGWCQVLSTGQCILEVHFTQSACDL